MKGRVSAGHLHYFTPETAIATLIIGCCTKYAIICIRRFFEGGIPPKTFNAKATDTAPKNLIRFITIIFE